MHPRNRYKDHKPDFVQLAKTHPPLERQLIKRSEQYSTLDFRDPKSQKELTVAILKHDFDLEVEVPVDKLIPTVPQKVNYIHWIEDLLAASNKDCVPRGPEVIGIDIGTGASCVYPLIGHAMNQWSFLATEISATSVGCAKRNVHQNGLNLNIEVQLVSPGTFLLGVLKKGQLYSFSMCNPPFYEDENDLRGNCSQRDEDRPSPSSINTGQAHETITPGGEVAFVKNLIDDSLALRDQVRWYTTMLGKKSSVKNIKAYLRDKEVPMVTGTEFVQGKTKRWGLAWSFDTTAKVPSKPPAHNTEKAYQLILEKCAHVTDELECDCSEEVMMRRSCLRFEALLNQLEVFYDPVEEATNKWFCRTVRATWANQRRKRRAMEGNKLCLAPKKKQTRTNPNHNNRKVADEVLVTDDSPESDNTTGLELSAQLRELSPPYVMDFKAVIAAHTETDKRKLISILLEVELIDGGDLDHLHQFVQYIRNHWQKYPTIDHSKMS